METSQTLAHPPKLKLPYSLGSIFNKLCPKTYSGRIAASVKSCGHQSVIKSPMQLRGGKYITIGQKCFFGRYGVLTAWDSFANEKFTPEIEIGNNVILGEYFHITAINSIKIGDNVLTGRWVTISDNAHGETDIQTLMQEPITRRLHSKGAVVIGDNVWIGDKATILAGVTIGAGVIIGANAVVTKDVPAYCIAAGNPAKIIRKTNNL